MASSVSSDNQQVRTSSTGLNFGPDFMRNPPQPDSFPQRQFALAQYRYGREEMLQIFEQIAGQDLLDSWLAGSGVPIRSFTRPYKAV